MNLTGSAVSKVVRGRAGWSRWVALVMGLAMVLSLVVATPAVAASVSAEVTVDSWVRDSGDETLVSYQITVTATGCGDTFGTHCVAKVQAWYADAHTEQMQEQLAVGRKIYGDGQGGPASVRFTGTDVTMAPVTSIRVEVTPYGGDPTMAATPVSDPFQYPAPDPSAQLVTFERDPDDRTQASWQVLLDFEGMGSPGAPCWETNTYVDRCYWRITLEHRSDAGTQQQDYDQGYLYADDSATGHSPTRTRTGSGTLAPITHVVVEMYGAYGSGLGSHATPYTFTIDVADPAAAVEHTEAAASEIEAELDLGAGDIPPEVVQAFMAATAVKGDAEILLMLAEAPCPRVNSSFNQCQMSFSAARAAGATTTSALARVLRIAGGAGLIAAGIGVVTHDALDATPEGEFPEPPADPQPVPPPPVGVPTFDPYIDPVPPTWVGSPEFEATVEESVRVAELLEVTPALVEGACLRILRGEEFAAVDIYMACLRWLGMPPGSMEAAVRDFAADTASWEEFVAIVDGIFADALPAFDTEPTPQDDPTLEERSWVPSYEHQLDLSADGLSREAIENMVEIAQAMNQWTRDHGDIDAVGRRFSLLHRTTHTVETATGELKTRRNDLGRAGQTAAIVETTMGGGER